MSMVNINAELQGRLAFSVADGTTSRVQNPSVLSQNRAEIAKFLSLNISQDLILLLFQ